MWPMNAKSPIPLQFLIKWLKYNLWLLWAIAFTIQYQNHWNMIPDCLGQFSLQFLIKLFEIWPMTAMGHFLCNYLSKSMKYDLTAKGNFLYNSLWKSLKLDLWRLGTICLPIAYQNQWHMTYDCWGQVPLQFLIKIVKIWPMTARDDFLYSSL